MKKIIGIVLAIVLLMTSCIGLTACNKTDDSTFTWLLAKGADESYISSYNENPVVKYLLSKEYNGNTLSLDFKTMVSGSESDQYATMISTGEYYDVLDTNYSPYSVATLYNMGIALDLTELIEEYMPNYLAFVNSNEELKRYAYTTVDGEKKMLQIVGGGISPSLPFKGYVYRRDWIVKYGVNPSTGEPFTGGYSGERDEEGKYDVNTWTDNIVFPSWYSDNKYVTEYKANNPEWDGTDPVFISDWEWMFEIFEKAFEDLGITDSYMVSMYYLGYIETGDFFSSFGGGAPLWSKSDGEVTFNATSDSMRSYLECLNTWYEKGWLDQKFSERSDAGLFWTIDATSTSQGKVPMMLGSLGKVGNSLQSKEYPLTQDLLFAPARLPINDVYGAESTKGVEPNVLYQGSYYQGSVIITSNAEDKDLATLLTFMDSLYTDEGGKIIALGLNKEQYEEIKDSLEKNKDGLDIYERYDLQNGAYYYEDGDIWVCDAIENVNYLIQAVTLDRISIGKKMAGGAKTKNIYSEIVYDEWDYYIASADIRSYSEVFSDDQSTTYSRIRNNINTKMSVEIPKFINGTYDLNGADWDTYVKTLNKMGHEKVTKIFKEVIESFN